MIFLPVASINDGDGNKYAPMAVLTRMPLPPFAPINVFESGVARKVNVFSAVSVDVDDEKLSALHRYTLRIIRAIMNKPYACSLEKMCYFLAPLPVSWSDPNAGVGEFYLPDITDQIRWDLVYAAADKAMAPLNSQDNQTLAAEMEDAVIQDRWVEFTRRYYAVTLRTDLSPMSKPDDSPVSRLH
jgi:endoribonuclease Dicer